jgi:hydroxypyruvate reductase
VSERAAHARLILRTAVAAADPAPAVRHAVSAAAELRAARRIHLLAVGKAAAVMADAALHTLPRAPDSALIIVPPGTAGTAVAALPAAVEYLRPARAPIRVLHAAHPIPDMSSAQAAVQIERQLADAVEGDIVLVLLSGGASSLSAAPAPGITIDEYATVVRALMHGGASIEELNTVRAHIDRLKCGGLARAAAPAHVLGLIVSDVAANALHVIASGPLTPCPSAAADAVRVLEKYGLWAAASDALRRVLQPERSAHRTGHASIDARHAAFSHVTTRIILDNATATAGAAGEARRLGYDVRTSPLPLTGTARDAGTRIARDARRTAADLQSGDRPVCLVYGGETTVIVKGSGLGGRNQELVLAAAVEIDGEPRITIGSLGTDGIDGPTDAAGAIADGETAARGRRVRLAAADALAENDSYSYFEATGELIRTGPTGTNVMDVQVALIDPPSIRDAE